MATFSFPHKIPIEYVGFFNQTGYGQSAISNVLSLHNSDKYDVNIKSLHGKIGKESFSPEIREKLLRFSAKTENIRSIQIMHCIPDMFRRVAARNRRIAFVTFETFQPPEHWIEILNEYDGVFCPSHFNKEQFLRAGLKRPMFVIPHVLNMDIWNENVSPLSREECFSFLFIGTWRRRKGYEILLEAWMREFGPDERVRLVVKTDETDMAIKDVLLFKKNLGKKDIAPIVFERQIFSEAQMASFIKSSHCYISPTLGEGFGLPALQAMALKVPVIITNFSGCQEYAKGDYCHLLEPSGFLVHERIDPIPQFANKKWPRIKVSDVQKAMREVFQKYNQAKEKADKAYKFVQGNFNYGVFVSKFDEMMETIYHGSYPKNQAFQRHGK